MTAPAIPVPTVIEDPLLPHQVQIKGSQVPDMLYATCSCLVREDGSYTALAQGQHLSGGEILDAQRKHEAAVTCWAYPLTLPERRELGLKLAAWYHRFRVAAQVAGRKGDGTLRASLAMAAAECADLGRDVTGAEVTS